MAIEVVRATVEDWERIRAVRLRALADAPDAFWTLLEDEQRRPAVEWQAHLASEDEISLLGLHDGQDAGLVWGARHHSHIGDDQPDGLDDAGLYGMWVAPEARGSGLAEALVRAVVEWARETGYSSLRLDVNDTNVAAQRLYAKCGFEPTGHRDQFPPPRDHIHEHELAIHFD
jgi:ribosomal protein S18 acetylase RimI-like enzyme